MSQKSILNLLVACFTILSRFLAESTGSTEPGTNLEARSCFMWLMHVNNRSEKQKQKMNKKYFKSQIRDK